MLFQQRCKFSASYHWTSDAWQLSLGNHNSFHIISHQPPFIPATIWKFLLTGWNRTDNIEVIAFISYWQYWRLQPSQKSVFFQSVAQVRTQGTVVIVTINKFSEVRIHFPHSTLVISSASISYGAWRKDTFRVPCWTGLACLHLDTILLTAAYRLSTTLFLESLCIQTSSCWWLGL